MINKVNNCVGCPPERGCLGDSCPNRNAVELVCDICGQEVDALFVPDGSTQQVCEDCLLEHTPRITADTAE